MNCPRCTTELATGALYCHVCGHQLSSGTAERRSFVVKPDEPVRSFRLVSTIMPTGAAERPRTYQIAFGIALAVAVVAALLGWTPIALMVAAFAVPIVYIVYLYDVNLWEDAPIPVTGLAFLLTGALAVGFTLLWRSWMPSSLSAGTVDGSGSTVSVTGVLIMAVLVPVVGELIRQVGPVLLASRPQFDDLMDGLTFGIISGVAYATGDTLVRHWSLVQAGFNDPGQGAVTWTSLMVLEGFIKPLVIGTATGIACAEFAGLGRGYDGFTPRYFMAVLEAVLWNVAYFGGVYLLSLVEATWLGLVLSLAWGALLLVGLVLRVRGVLQTGLLEAALEKAARFHGAAPVGADGVLDHCPACEMPLMAGAAFCGACGTAIQATAAGHQGGATEPDVGPPPMTPDSARWDDEEAR
ncbi:PrsW family intramembrane metalloprotease [Propionibacteriaceae bacterium G1746]|uniref:PrsW family intramembrane metalloprotease n=1 Tax=Aestuariimicrobium sp. G57 TaxID=3418485 RepID=UPI003C1DE532